MRLNPNMRTRQMPDKALLASILTLLIFGWLMSFSASLAYFSSYSFFFKQTVFICAGLFAGLIILNTPISTLQKCRAPARAARPPCCDCWESRIPQHAVQATAPRLRCGASQNAALRARATAGCRTGRYPHALRAPVPRCMRPLHFFSWSGALHANDLPGSFFNLN